MKTTAALILFSFALLYAPTAQADTFGSSDIGIGSDPTLFEIEFVPIGNAGNPDDTTGNPNPEWKSGKGDITDYLAIR